MFPFAFPMEQKDITLPERWIDIAIAMATRMHCTDPKCRGARDDQQGTKKCERCELLEHLQGMKRQSLIKEMT